MAFGLRVAGALALALVLAGCGGIPAGWEGTWVGERRDLVTPEKNDDIARSLRAVRIIIHADGGFEKIEAGISSAGKGRFAADLAYLRETTRLGRPIEEDANIAREALDLVLEKKPDGTLDYRDPRGMEGAVSLRRVAAEER
ncbi:MAG: hypothetical protein MH204_07545 [Fimbriimonadaceae bacterium]|nr:hypothetical protein [Fimbriimonadaceae bacterium]